jgi:squalene synthase HpnC
MNMPTNTSPSIQHYENFPVASWLCPPHLRAPITAIYHFARTADDIADEGNASADQRLCDLTLYRQALQSVCHSEPIFSIPPSWERLFESLQTVVHQYKLPCQLLHDLLDAFEQDVRKTAEGAGYESHDELLAYCKLSANPVGRLLLHLYGIDNPSALERSDAICSALQLINFWQDLSVDIPRYRYYLPRIEAEKIQDTAKLVAHLVKKARGMMQMGAPLVHQIPGRAGWELRLVVQGGLRITDRIESLHFATLTQRPILRWWDFPVILWRAIWM